MMGASNSSELSEDAVDELRKSTHFSAHEIREMHEKFSTDFPEGVITQDRFVHMYAGLFPDGDARRFAKHVFRAYDADGNGEVDFSEFMTTLSVAAKGSVEEKLKWAYHLYDLDGDGKVTRPEAVEMIMAIYRMQGVPNAGERAEYAAVQLFCHMDKNQDDSLSEAEFVIAVRHSPVVRELLQGTGT